MIKLINANKNLCIVFIVSMFIISLFTPIESRALDGNSFRLVEVDENTSSYVNIVLGELLKNLDVNFNQGEEFTFENDGRGQIKVRDEYHDYEGSIFLEGKKLSERQSSEYAITGNMHFTVEVFVGHENALMEENYDFQGPFAVTRQGMLVPGIDALNPDREPVKGENKTRIFSITKIPERVKLSITEDAIERLKIQLPMEILPLYEMLIALDLELSVNESVNTTLSWSFGDAGVVPTVEETIGTEASINETAGTLNLSLTSSMIDNRRIEAKGTFSYNGHCDYDYYAARPDDWEKTRRWTTLEGDTYMIFTASDDEGVLRLGPTMDEIRTEGHMLREVRTLLTDGEERNTTSQVDPMLIRYNLEPVSVLEQKIEESVLVSPMEFSRGIRDLTFAVGSVGDKVAVIIDTDAAESPGATPFSVPAAIVVGAAGMIAAAGAAGASAAGSSASSGGTAGGSDKGTRKKEEKESTYKMILYKDFGNEIQFNNDPVYVYARMVEVTEEGEEIPRPDLTQRIEIFSDDKFIELGTPAISGEYMAASVKATAPDPEELVLEVSKDSVEFLMDSKDSERIEINLPQSYSKGVISFRFTGEGGLFQNNVAFNMVEEEWDFDAELRFDKDEGIVDFEIEKEKDNKAILTITEGTTEIDETESYQAAEIKIIANAPQGEVIRIVKAIVWQEGIFVMDTKTEYKIKADGEKEKLPLQLRALTWNEERKTVENNPELLSPDRLQIQAQPSEDQTKKALEVGQLNPEHHATNDAFSVYNLYIENEIPGGGIVLDVPIKISVKGMDEENFTREITLKVETTEMLPIDREQEIQRCQEIIDRFVPDAYKGRMQDILDKRAPVLGAEGLYELRHQIWNIAQLLTLGEGGQGYLDEAKWADRITTVLEWAEWAGEHCFNAIIEKKLGPVGKRVAPLIRGMVIDSIKAYCYEGQDPITWLQGYINQIDLATIGKKIAEEGWEAVEEDLKEREIIIRGSTWSVKIPGWLAIKGVTAMQTFVTKWTYEGKSLYEAASETTWDLTDSAIGSRLEKMLGDD